MQYTTKNGLRLHKRETKVLLEAHVILGDIAKHSHDATVIQLAGDSSKSLQELFVALVGSADAPGLFVATL